jgi:hypothetical protein
MFLSYVNVELQARVSRISISNFIGFEITSISIVTDPDDGDL